MEGQTLTASYDFFDANVGDEEDEQATEIKWYAASGSSPANWGTAIGTGKTYTLTSNEVGKYIKAEVTPYSKAEPKKGTPASSPVYGPVLAAQALPSVSNVLLTGEAKVGSILTVGYTFTPTGGEGNSTYGTFQTVRRVPIP